MGKKQALITFPNDKATNDWLAAQKRNTRNCYRSIWHQVLTSKFIGKSGDQILAERREQIKSEDIDVRMTYEKLVMSYNQELRERGVSANKVKTMTSAIRSFFNYHYVPLKFRKQEREKLKEAKRVTEDYKFTKDELRRMSDIADLEGKYIVSVGKDLGLRAGDFLKLTRGVFDPYIDRNEVPLYLGEYETEKESIKANLFLTRESVEIVKAMLNELTRKGKTSPNDRMLGFSDEDLLTRKLKNLAHRIGINNGNVVIRFHCLRKYLTDRLSSITSESKWKQIVGKKIAEGAYVGPLELTEVYTKALPLISFNVNGSNGTVEELKNKIATLEKDFNSLKLGVVRTLDVLQSTALGIDPDSVRMAMEQLCDALGVDINEIHSTRQLRKIVTGKEEEK